MNAFPAAMASPKPRTDSFSLSEFSQLHLSVSLESTKYSFIPLFLTRILNLENDLLLLDRLPQNCEPRASVEVLPQIIVPQDLWLIQDIVIRQLRLKTTILRDVNALLLMYAEQLRENNLFLIDDAALAAIDRRVVENRLIDFSKRDASPERFDALHEADELDDTADEQGEEDYLLFLRRSIADASDTLSRTSTRPMSSSGSIQRLLSFLRELMGSRRKFSFMALPPHDEKHPKSPQGLPILNSSPVLPHSHSNHVHGNGNTVSKSNSNGNGRSMVSLPSSLPRMNSHSRAHTLIPPPSPVLSRERESFHGLASGFLSKSRIYSRMKKRRELGQLAASTTTTMSTASSTPHRIKTDDRLLLIAQRSDNQRGKHDYYLQMKLLSELTQVLVGYLGKSGVRANLARLMEFIKNSVFKFILVDICQMIVDYGRYKIKVI